MYTYIKFSESLSVLQSLHKRNLSNPTVHQVLIKRLSVSQNFVFCCLSSHVGIQDNDEADKEAKIVLDLNIAKFRRPFTDFKLQINNYIVSKWQL